MAIFSFLSSACFSSGIITRLTTPTFTQRLTSIRDLVENDFFWVTKYKTDVLNLLKMDDPWEKEWARRLIIARSKEEFTHYAMSRKMALLGEHVHDGFIAHLKLPERILANYETAPFCINKCYIAIAHRRGSPYFSVINYYIHRFHASGIIKKTLISTIDKTVPSAPHMREVFRTNSNKLGNMAALSLDQLKDAFVIWLCGIILACITMLIEVLIACKISINYEPNQP